MADKIDEDRAEIVECKKLKIAKGNGENGNYEELLASVKFPIWDYDYDGLIANIKLIISESGVKDKWQIPDANLDGFLMSVRSHYQENPYHNFRHAFCVTQMVYSILSTLSKETEITIDSWGVLIIAAIAHDVDHPGLTNGFLRKSSDSLVALYGDESTLEYHHFTTLCNILRNRKNDIFVNILQHKIEMLRRIRELILVTDMAKQPAFIASSNTKLDADETLSTEETLKLTLKCADISNEVRPVKISQPMIESLYVENFAQGKLEKQLNMEVTPIMDEENVSKDDTQRDFHSNVTLPIFRLLARAYPTTKRPFLVPLENVAEKEYGIELK